MSEVPDGEGLAVGISTERAEVHQSNSNPPVIGMFLPQSDSVSAGETKKAELRFHNKDN